MLDQAIGAKVRTFAKVRLDQLLQVPAAVAGDRRRAARNAIARQHVDFVLCDPADLRALAVVELDDADRGGDRTEERDASVDEALASAGIPVIRFVARSGYAVDDVRRRLDAVLPAAPTAASSARRKKSGDGKAGRPRDRAGAPVPAMPAPVASTTLDVAPASGSDAEPAAAALPTAPAPGSTPATVAARRTAATIAREPQGTDVERNPYARLGSCPSCGRPLVERIAKRGAQKGKPILVCSGDPPCGAGAADG